MTTNIITVNDQKDKIEEAAKYFKMDYFDLAVRFHEKQPFFFSKEKIWWVWDFEDRCYRVMDKTDMLNKIHNELRVGGERTTSPRVKSEITTALQMVGRRRIPRDFFPNWVQFKNKIYDIQTSISYTASPGFFNVNTCPWALGDSEDTPVLDQLFEDWVGEDMVLRLYQILAYCLCQDYPLNRMFYLIGSGSNGKSCFLNVLHKFLGNTNCATTELESLLERFGTSCLYKKLVCIMGETNSHLLEKSSILKRLTGNDLVEVEFKGIDRISYRNYAKLIIATNLLPKTQDRTYGFYRRMLIVKFPNQFKEKKDIMGSIPDQEYNNLATKLMRILKELLENREFHKEGTVEEREMEYEKHSNPLKEFIKLKCVLDRDGAVPIFDLYDKYDHYLKERGYNPISKKALTALLKEDGIDTHKKHVEKTDGSKTTWMHYIGIRLRESIFDYSDNNDNNDKKSQLDSLCKTPSLKKLSLLSSISKTQISIVKIIKSHKDGIYFVDLVRQLSHIEMVELNKELSTLVSIGTIFQLKPGKYACAE